MEERIRKYTPGEEGYPGRLRELPDPPRELYVTGELPPEGQLAVAIVGARDCSEYGRYVAGELGRLLGRKGIPVISGMARGIDGISQQAALDGGGKSYGVLGCGVDVCYPAKNRSLYEQLGKRGGLISEYPPGTPPSPWNFPPRNRIVSGLADVLVVIEARVKSGTLITVDMALEQGKEVYVVPGRVTDRLSDGCNRLIKEGAGVLLSPEAFLQELAERGLWKPRKGKEPGQEASEEQGTCRREISGEREEARRRGELDVILGKLDFSPKTIERIRAELPEEYGSRLLPSLIQLCIEKKAVQVSPGSFARSGEGRF